MKIPLGDGRVENQNAWRDNLKSFYWLGGSAASGKTTICSYLSEHFGVGIHHRDDMIEDHWTRINPQDQPALWEWREFRERGSLSEFLSRPVDDLVSLLVTAFHEDFPLTLEDLSQTKLNSRTIVEGLRLPPNLLVPLLEDKSRAIWIVPSLDLHKDLITRRSNKPGAADATREAAQRQEHLSSVLNELAVTLGIIAAEQGASVVRIEHMEDLVAAPNIIAHAWGLA